MEENKEARLYKDPNGILEDGVKFLENNDYENALIAFHHLLNFHGPNDYLLFYIGTVNMHLGNVGMAKILLKMALDDREEFPEAWNNLGFCYHSRCEMEEAEKCFNRAAQIDPNNPDLMVNIGSLYVNDGNPDKCIKWCKQALKLSPDHEHAKWNMGLALLEKGEWEKGWKYYDEGASAGNRGGRTYDIDPEKPMPVWDGTPGKRVIVYGEQGVGDEILFSSMIPDILKTNDIIFDCHPRLKNLFHHSFPELSIYGTRKEKQIYWLNWEKADAKIAIGSLGNFYRKKPSDAPKTPYLKADPMLVSEYKERLDALGPKKKIAISWKGGTLSTNKGYRSMPLDDFSDFILDNKDKADFISLQYTPEAKMIVDEFNEKYGVTVHHWQDTVNDLDEMAAVLANVDLVISVCTSLVHMAGAMGVKCWCLCPSKPAWRYALKGYNPWYGSVKMYRQKKSDWKPILGQINNDLGRFLC